MRRSWKLSKAAPRFSKSRLPAMAISVTSGRCIKGVLHMLNEQEIAGQNSLHIVKKHSIKCLVWDLDNTLWENVLLEDEQVTLRAGVVEVVKALDNRGILHSIASKNDYPTAMRK